MKRFKEFLSVSSPKLTAAAKFADPAKNINGNTSRLYQEVSQILKRISSNLTLLVIVTMATKKVEQLKIQGVHMYPILSKSFQ